MELDNKPMPGAPPESPKPIKSEEKLTFQYADLLLENAYYVGSKLYLRFFVDIQDAYFIDVSRAEFIEYQNNYFTLFEMALSQGTCSCDRVTPKLTETDQQDLTMISVKPDTNETIEEVVSLKIYLAEDLSDGLEVGIHSPEEHIKG